MHRLPKLAFPRRLGAATFTAKTPGDFTRRTSIQFSVCNEAGGLLTPLSIFKEHNISLLQLQPRSVALNESSKAITMYCDFEGHTDDAHVQQCLAQLREITLFMTVVGSHKIPYYPSTIEELDFIEQKTLAAGEELQDDPENPHPGFHDEEYKTRRRAIVRAAQSYRHGDSIPRVEYSRQEIATWGAVWKELMKLFPTHTCRQYQYNFPLMVENCGYAPNNIPQLQDISEFLKHKTGFTIRPVAGLLSGRDFLNALAFRVFFSTQYIRHHSKPFYTPEPDVIHELMGHAPLFADPEFADFSQQIGLASLGASDEDIQRLATCYWFSVEFGLCRQDGKPRAYGAGLLSSFGEMSYALAPVLGDATPGICGASETPAPAPEYRPFDPFAAAQQPYPITTYQPVYYVADSFRDAEEQMRTFAQSLGRPFRLEYNPYTQSVRTFPNNTEQCMQGRT